MLNDVRDSNRRLWWAAGAPALVCWTLIAYLAAIEVIQAGQGGDTEHSPLSVLLYLLGPTLLLTWTAVALHRWGRSR
jgi:hypothetical protein